jgi:hypothetical protein
LQTRKRTQAPPLVHKCGDSTGAGELQAWPAQCAMLICAARLRTDAVRAAIRPSTVHAELQTLCSNTHWLIPAALAQLARAKPFEARRPSQRSAPAHRNPACSSNRRVCAHANSARKETYAAYVLLAWYEQHSRLSESSVRLAPIACAPRRPPAPLAKRYQRPTPVACQRQRGGKAKSSFVRGGSVARRPASMEVQGAVTHFPCRTHGVAPFAIHCS